MVHCVSYLRYRKYAPNAVYTSFFDKDFPARSAVAVTALPKGVLVEIEAIAIK